MGRQYCMIKRVNNFFAGLPMTIVGGIFLMISFFFTRLISVAMIAAIAIGQATKHGVIIKSGEALEKMGKAIVTHIREKGVELTESVSFQMQSGKGIYAEISGIGLYIGNEKYILQSGINLAQNVKKELERLCIQGKEISPDTLWRMREKNFPQRI